MKNIIQLLIILISTNSLASELDIVSSTIVCNKADGSSLFKYSYHVGAIIKNKSSESVKIITNFKTPQSSNISFGTIVFRGKSVKQFRFGSGHATFNNQPIIPSESSLNLVTLRPGELTQVSGVHNTIKPLDIDGAIVSYSSISSFDDRFGYWVGSVQGKKPDFVSVSSCQS